MIHVTPTMHFTVRMESALGKNGAAMEKTTAGTGTLKVNHRNVDLRGKCLRFRECYK